MSSVINTVAEAAITAVSKMKEGAHNLISGPSSALSPKAESQEDVATGVTTKYGFCGLGKDGMLTSVVQKMSNGDKNVLVKLLIPNDPHQPSSTSSLGGPSLQFVDNLENLFKDSEVIFLALSGESLEEYAKSGLLRSAIVSADGPTKAIVVFGDIDSSVIATIAAELSSFQHIDLLKVTPLSSEKTNAAIKQIYCASGSEQVIGKIGDFLNAIGGRPMYVGANLVDAARLIELYAAYESIVAAALFEVCWEAKQLDIDLRNFFRKLPVQRITTVKSAVELADAFVNGDPEKFQFIQKNLDARLATARQTLMLRNRAQPVNLEPQSNGTMPARDDVDAGEKPTSREKIVENGIADEQKPTTTTNKVDNRRGKSNVTTAENSRSSSRTRRTGATVVNDAARVHIMGAEDDDEDEKAEAVPSLAGANDEQQSNGTADQQNKRGGAGRPKRGAVEEPTKGTRASTRSRTNTADSSNKEQNGTEKRATDRQKKSSDAPQTAEKSTRKAAKGGFSDVAVDPTSTKIAEPSPNNTAEQQQSSTNTTQSGGAGEAPDRKFFKSTGGPAATGSGTSTPGKGAFATAFGRLNETKGGTQNTGVDGSPPAKKTEHAALSQPPPNAVDIADLPELDTTPTNTGASKPQNSIPTGNNKPPGRKAAGTPSAAEKKKNAQIAQSAKRAKSKLGAQTTAGESGSAADAEPTDESQQKTPVKGKKRGNDTTADGGGNETDDTATSSTTKKQATDKKQTKGGKTSPTSTKKGATSTSSGASKKRAADEDEEETDDDDEDDDEENTSSGDTESEQRFTLDDAKRETDRGAGWKELPEITTPTNIKYTKNDIVWSKITGYPWWPAQIVGLYQVTGKQSPTYEVRVTWLGDNNWSDLKIDQIAPYTEESKAKHAQKKKDKSYQLACMAADLLKSTPNMSVVEATDKAKMQYSTKSPVKGGRAAAAAVATADGPAESAGQKKKTANKKQKTDADASAAATRTRESLRRGAKDKIAEKTGGATSAEISAENKVDSKKQRDADEAADEEKQQDATDDKTSVATADDSTTKAVTDSAESAATTTTTQAEQSNSKDDDSKPTTDKKSGAPAAVAAASDDGEEGTSQLEIDES